MTKKKYRPTKEDMDKDLDPNRIKKHTQKQKEESGSKKWKVMTGIFGGLAIAALATTGVGFGLYLSKESPQPIVEDTYTLTADVDSGIQSITFDVDGQRSDKAKAGQTVKVNISEKEDYAIESLTYNGIDMRQAKTFIMPKANCTIQAKTTLNVAYITLELNGGTCEGPTTIKVPKGEYFGYADLPKVSKTNAFEGEWYLDKEMTKVMKADTIINESATIYKNWFNIPADYPSVIGIHANSDSQLLAFYEAIESNDLQTNSIPSNEDEGVISVKDLKYSTDGTNWNEYPVGSGLKISAGQNILIKSKQNWGSTAGVNKTTRFVFHGDVSLSGSVLGLFDDGQGQITSIPSVGMHALFKDSDGITTVSKDFINISEIGSRGCERMFENCINLEIACDLPATKLDTFAYYGMFRGCSKLYKAPTSIGTADTQMQHSICNQMFVNCYNLISPCDLPATTLHEYCYQQMFQNCTNLKVLPKLSATKLTTSCYDRMFNGCTSLVEIPEDYFTGVTHSCFYCCNQMFEGCTSLTNAPILPAEKMQYFDPSTSTWTELEELAERSYDRMFNGCVKLSKINDKMLPATKLGKECYAGMFQNCTSLKTSPELPATTLAEYCYSNMFYNSGLVVAPILSTTDLAEYCYNAMFAYCRNLQDAPTLSAQYLPEGCYQAMFYECSSLKTAVVGPSDPNQRISLSGNYCCQQMFNRCVSLEFVKFNYSSYMNGSYFWKTFTEVNSNMVLYCDSPSTYYNSDNVDLSVTIKPFSDACVFVQILPADLIDGEVVSSNLTPYHFPGNTDYCAQYTTKYGSIATAYVTQQAEPIYSSCRFITNKDNTVATTINSWLNPSWEGSRFIRPKTGCYIDRIEYYDTTSSTWKDTSTLTSEKFDIFTADANLRVVFAPTKAVTCSWTDFIKAITDSGIYDSTDAGTFNAASDLLCAAFKEEGKFSPSSVWSFIGLTKELTINGQVHNVTIVDTCSDYNPLTTVEAGKYLTNALFTFHFQNVISDEDGYSLGTTWNGAGDASKALDYTNSDLRKAVEGEGSGKIRWYRKSETAQTEVETYKNKSVLDMLTTSHPEITSAIKQVKKKTRIGTESNISNAISFADATYDTKLFVPSMADIDPDGGIYTLYSDRTNYPGTVTYFQRQVKGWDGSISEVTIASGDEGTVNKVSNIAGLNYNNDWWYGTSYWTSSPYENDDQELGYELGNCANIFTYEGGKNYEIGKKWAMAVAPMFCL